MIFYFVFLNLISALLRFLFIIFPFTICIISKISRSLFSPSFNEKTVLKAALGLQCLNGKLVETSNLFISVVLPASVKLSLNDYTQATTFYSGLPPICSTLMEHSQKESMFFDIGANIGLVSIAMSNILEYNYIHAFEINPETFKKLQSNFENHCPGAHAHQIGLSDKLGSMSLSVISNDSGSSSLDTARFENAKFWHGQKIRPSQIDVSTTTFDSWSARHCKAQIIFSKSLLFKIDVEGHELAVLNGMQNFLLETNGKSLLFVVETENTNIEKIRGFFERHGFVEHRPWWNPDLSIFPHHTDLVFKRFA